MGCYTSFAVLLEHAAGRLSVDHIDEVGVPLYLPLFSNEPSHRRMLMTGGFLPLLSWHCRRDSWCLIAQLGTVFLKDERGISYSRRHLKQYQESRL